jgi:hypothetical protein
MTKAFLEPMVLKKEHEKFVIEAFSKSNFDKIKAFESKRKEYTKKSTTQKLKLSDLL